MIRDSSCQNLPVPQMTFLRSSTNGPVNEQSQRHDTAAFNNFAEDDTVRRQLRFEGEENEVIEVQRLNESMQSRQQSRREAVVPDNH